MLKYLKQLISTDCNSEENINSQNKISELEKVQVATCALFIEVANSDDEFTNEEKETIIKLMKEIFSLDDEVVKELIELSEEEIKESISLYEFTTEINKNFTKDEKYEVVKNLWKLILVDNKIHSHEDYFIRMITKNLNLSHKEMIAAKMEIKGN